jgi:hypothetical protein
VRFNPVLIFFTLGGAALVVVSYLPGVTEFLDAHASAGSDPAGPVLQMIGWIWLAVSFIPLVFGAIAKRKGLDRMFKSTATALDEDLQEQIQSRFTSFQTAAIPAANLAQSLEQLAKLHEQGVLSDEQFETAKRQILGA